MLSFSRFQIFKFLENYFPFFVKKKVKSNKNGSWKEQAFDEGRQEGPEEEDRRPFHSQGMVRRQSPRHV